MKFQNFYLRNITPHVMSLLKKKAAEQKMSVNSLILKYIHESLGLVPRSKPVIYHDLDPFFGKWSQAEREEFTHNIKDFEKIDKEIWQ